MEADHLLALIGVVLVVADYTIKVLAIGVLPSNRKPSSAMAWLILILIIPFAGFVIFLFLGRTNVGAKSSGPPARGRTRRLAPRPTGCPSTPVAGPVYLELDRHPEPRARARSRCRTATSSS